MLTLILALTAISVIILITGFLELKLPLVSQHTEMHLLTYIKESINHLLHADQNKNQNITKIPA